MPRIAEPSSSLASCVMIEGIAFSFLFSNLPIEHFVLTGSQIGWILLMELKSHASISDTLVSCATEPQLCMRAFSMFPRKSPDEDVSVVS